jgi:hypothetical protein
VNGDDVEIAAPVNQKTFVSGGGDANWRKSGTLQPARRIVQIPPLMSTRWNPQRDSSLKVSKSLASTVAQARGAASRIR